MKETGGKLRENIRKQESNRRTFCTDLAARGSCVAGRVEEVAYVTGDADRAIVGAIVAHRADITSDVVRWAMLECPQTTVVTCEGEFGKLWPFMQRCNHH